MGSRSGNAISLALRLAAAEVSACGCWAYTRLEVGRVERVIWDNRRGRTVCDMLLPE